MGLLSARMSVPVHAVPEESRRGHQILWHWSYRWFLTTLCMFQDPNMGSLQQQAASALNQ